MILDEAIGMLKNNAPDPAKLPVASTGGVRRREAAEYGGRRQPCSDTTVGSRFLSSSGLQPFCYTLTHHPRLDHNTTPSFFSTTKVFSLTLSHKGNGEEEEGHCSL
ncbi:unnamed protein product [Cuscuta epithymum]|uniref:Uncharacterized protein n=1 Tax=Cuscuta epithymum TaxID=186058 RepID=A0AAV0D7P0_9ASTE|nr:unnamed protein product [Cuscuta epithymum]